MHSWNRNSQNKYAPKENCANKNICCRNLELKPSAKCSLHDINTHVHQTVTQVYRNSNKWHLKIIWNKRTQGSNPRIGGNTIPTPICSNWHPNNYDMQCVLFTTHKICTPGHRVWNSLFTNILNWPLHGTDQRGKMPHADDLQVHKTGNMPW